ncbi:zinc finger protein ZFP2-like [Leguminivora glycinivorella]|uniref:zinc finger protein ZFP2-like n=1 Tax=Leguminivora glycinivorella TaxID=1035111 RepID=UPI00200C912A|nr:zinc finger protein ZFP2-like [Leguminivora glycinivorella]
MSSSMIEDPVKLEVTNESFRACRVCLAWDVKLYSIYEWGLSDMFMEIMGTTISVWDGLPQHLCVWCRVQLGRARALRARCRRSDALLKQALQHQHFITDFFIRTIDRSMHGLTNTLSSHRNPENVIEIDIYDQASLDDDRKLECKDIIQKSDTENDKPELDLNWDDDDDVFLNKLSSDSEYEQDLSKVKKKMNKKVATVHKLPRVEIVEVNIEPQDIVVEEKKTRKRTVRQKIEKKAKEKVSVKVKSKAKVKSQVKIKVKETNNIKDNDTVKVRKRKPQRFIEKLGTEEEIKEFEKKYNFQVQNLTEEEMAKDMEERKKSDNYLNGMYKCELCYKGFLTHTSYNNHLKSHDVTRGEHECQYCHLRYHTPGKLRDHMRNAHRLKFLCAVCSKFMAGLQCAILHAAFHSGTTFQCAHCDKQFLKKTSRSTHMRIAHPLENASIGTCELCGEIFTSRQGLKMHKTRSHRESLDRSLFCRKCRLQFETTEALRRHKDQQPGKRCYNNKSACQQCGALFKTEEGLIQHKRETHGVELFTCDACNKSFLSKMSLSVHIDRLHLNIKPGSGRQQYYARLQRKRGDKPKGTQPREKKNVCEVCGKSFTCLSVLKTHQLDHTGDRPFKCSQCPKAYLYAWQLRNHSDCVHRRIRKWRCSECPKTFLHQSSVYVHKLIHTGKRTHMCSYCGKAFLQSGSLYTHVKYVHLKVKPPPRKRKKDKPCL